jgi:hypothetical protein
MSSRSPPVELDDAEAVGAAAADLTRVRARGDRVSPSRPDQGAKVITMASSTAATQAACDWLLGDTPLPALATVVVVSQSSAWSSTCRRWLFCAGGQRGAGAEEVFGGGVGRDGHLLRIVAASEDDLLEIEGGVSDADRRGAAEVEAGGWVSDQGAGSRRGGEGELTDSEHTDSEPTKREEGEGVDADRGSEHGEGPCAAIGQVAPPTVGGRLAAGRRWLIVAQGEVTAG